MAVGSTATSTYKIMVIAVVGGTFSPRQQVDYDLKADERWRLRKISPAPP